MPAVRIGLVVAVGVAAGVVVWWRDTTTQATVTALVAQHATDSLAADAASAIASRAVSAADSVRRAYRGRPAVTDLTTPLLAALDTAALAREQALEALVNARAGVDSLRAVVRGLVAADAHRDTVARTTLEGMTARVTAAERVIAQDSTSLAALAAARDAERVRAISAERLVAGWQADAQREARRARMWQGLTIAAAVVAVIHR